MTTAPQLSVVFGDITKQNVDAIVNAANETLLGGGGVDGAIHRAAGPKLLEECRAIGGCKTGQSRITKGYNLPARYVIHTVGPIWKGGERGEDGLLRDCYLSSLQLADRNEVKSLAFPSVSTGAYGFPIDRAARIAASTVREYLSGRTKIVEVRFVCFSQSDFDIYKRLLGSEHQPI
jgi:O-acetyl-ADP-ribose deacetylase (regulator of RNase III)